VTTVLDRGTAAPGTHALIIGVGTYDHLLDGPGPMLDSPYGLKQLGSPPMSAKKFAEWLLTDLRNNTAPLASVEVLISSTTPTSVSVPGVGHVAVEAANMENILAAGDRWFARANALSENVAVFYHCGHGLQSSDLALLAQDFGAPGGAPARLWSNAYSFDQTYRGMGACKANGQFFFVDACRQTSADLLNFDGLSLQTLADPVLRGNNATRNAPILYATAREAQAFAQSDKVSRFTDALILALGSNGSSKSQGRWRISNDTLGLGVIKRIEFGNVEGVPHQDCVLDGESSGTTVLHELDATPAVPSVLKVGPTTGTLAAATLAFHLNDNPMADLTASGPSPWTLDVLAGSYSVKAVDGPQVLLDLPGEWVLPPAYERDMA
jgi:Caspase domain